MVANKFLNAPITERDTRGTSTQVIFFALWIFFSLLFGMRFRSVFFLNWRLLSYSREHLLRIPNKHQVNAKRSKKHATEPLVLRERKREKKSCIYCVLHFKLSQVECYYRINKQNAAFENAFVYDWLFLSCVAVWLSRGPTVFMWLSFTCENVMRS